MGFTPPANSLIADYYPPARRSTALGYYAMGVTAGTLMANLLGGQIPAAIVSLTDAIEHHRAGKARIVAVSGPSRAKVAPEVPTFTELGLKGLDKNPWLAFFGPRGLPPVFVDRFTKAVAAVLAQPDMNERLAKIGNEVLYANPEQLQRDWVVSATRHWAPVVKESGWELQ